MFTVLLAMTRTSAKDLFKIVGCLPLHEFESSRLPIAEDRGGSKVVVARRSHPQLLADESAQSHLQCASTECPWQLPGSFHLLP